MELEPGQVLDRYTLEARIGTGGMASVYRVRHNVLDSVYALKILHIGGPALRERLMQEGRVQARLRHPNIVSVTDVLDVGGSLGLLMEYIDGVPMDRWLREHRPALPQALEIFDGILAGVARAHREGLVHRDLKPANVLLDRVDGRLVPKVADFGLVKALDEDSDTRTTRTRSGMAMGTPAYMAPEQIRDASRVDHRADIFSLGCILYELVTGRRPFEGADMMDTFTAITTGTYVPADVAVEGLDPAVGRTIKRCLLLPPAERPQSCEELRALLHEDHAAGAPHGARPLDPLGSSGAPGALPHASSVDTMDPAGPTVLPRRRLVVRAGALALGLGLGLGFAGWIWQGSSPGPTAASPALTGPVQGGSPPVDATAGPDAATPDAGIGDPARAVVGAATEPMLPVPRSLLANAASPATPTGPRATGTTATLSATSQSPATSTSTPTAAAPPPATGTFTATGDARSTYLEASAGRFRAGEAIPTGTYTIFALFSGSRFVDAGRLEITSGGAASIDCIAAFTTCAAK